MERKLPVTVLAWEGPQARAYLVRMARSGMRVSQILLMVADPSARRRGDAGRRYSLPWAERLQDTNRNYHPYQIRRRYPALVRAIANAMTPFVVEPEAQLSEMYDGFSYDDYADDVVRIRANSVGSPQVEAALKERVPGTVLFTGGGIVPGRLLAIPGLRMIHVHPGHLPDVRGADGLLWSLLVRGRPGVSAFVLAPGLDVGDILAARDLSPLCIPHPSGTRLDDDTLYRAVFSFVDPLIRAEHLVTQVLEPNGNPATWEATRQDLALGTTYRFMHRGVRNQALHRLFPSPPHSPPSPVSSRRHSPSRFDAYYTHQSRFAPMHLRLAALVAPSRIRALSLRNRGADYRSVAGDARMRALHAEFNKHLGAQFERWPSYDYGEGWFYQSSTDLRITGLRNTSARLDAYDLPVLVRNREVLEIGCNSGFLSIALARSARRVVGLDLNPHLIAIAEAARTMLEVDNVTFLVAAFEQFRDIEGFDDVVSFANHQTYDGNTHQGLDAYFAKCHELTRPGGRLIFESHPPELEADRFGDTLRLIDRYYEIEHCAVHDYGTFLDRGRRFLIGRRRERGERRAHRGA